MFGWTFNNELEKYKKSLDIVTEAPDDAPTDYAAAAKQLDNAPSASEAAKMDAQNPEMNDEATDYSDGAEDTADNYDDNADAENADENPDDTSEEGDDMEATDYDEGSPDAGDEEADPEADTGEEDTSEEETPEDDGDKSKNTYLIRDFIELFYTTKNMIEKLNNVSKTTLVKSKVYLQVIENLSDMNNVLYEYITHDFSKKSYVFNLYQFNLFLECIKVNIEIIKKSGELQSND